MKHYQQNCVISEQTASNKSMLQLGYEKGVECTAGDFSAEFGIIFSRV